LANFFVKHGRSSKTFSRTSPYKTLAAALVKLLLPMTDIERAY
jgi:hypothetical protein